MKLFKEVIQFDAQLLQSGGGSGLGMWSEYMRLGVLRDIIC